MNYRDQVNEPINKQSKNLCKLTSVKERPQQHTKFIHKSKVHNPTTIDKPIHESTVARSKNRKNKKNKRKIKRNDKRSNKQSRCPSNNLCARINSVHQNQNKIEQNKRTQINSKTKLKETKLRKFAVGDRVYVNQTFIPVGSKRKFYPRFSGPYRIIKETSPVNFIVEDIKTKKRILVHSNRLKPAIARMEFDQQMEERSPSRQVSSTPEVIPEPELILGTN